MSSSESLKKYRRTKKGVLTNIYAKQMERSKKKGFPMPNYSSKYLHLRFLDDIKFNRIFKEWVKSNYSKPFKPSIDRINHKKPYTKENIQILRWSDNRYKESMERRNLKGDVYQMLNGGIVNKYKSQREAVKLNRNFTQSMLSQALTGVCKTAYGYNWVYKSEIIGNIHDA